jgi:pimeloyl-ACP methyl ester carboxylesterase
VLCFHACTITDLPTKNIVMVDGKGRMVSSTPHLWGLYFPMIALKRMSQKAAKAHVEKVIRQLECAREAARLDAPHEILLYVHGGLNTQVGALQRAAELYPAITADPSGPTPVFLNWQSSLLSSYYDHLMWIRQGKEMCWGPLMAPLVLLEDLGNAVLRAPRIWLYQLGHTGTVLTNSSPDETSAAARWTELEKGTKESPTLIRRGDELRPWWQSSILGTSALLTLPLRLALAPLVDAAGTPAWDNMRRRTSMAFHRESEFSSKNLPDRPRGGYSLFLDRLLAKCCAEPEKWTITLMGHSMGTIIVNQVLRQYPDLPIQRIVYMAAACSVRDYQDTVFPYLEAHPGTQMYHLVLHEDAENQEICWPAPEFVPRGSLLVWIDNFFEKPETWLDRMAGRWVNLLAGIYLRPEQLRGRIHIKQFDHGAGSDFSHPQKHGGFAEKERDFWKPAYWATDSNTEPTP